MAIMAPSGGPLKTAGLQGEKLQGPGVRALLGAAMDSSASRRRSAREHGELMKECCGCAFTRLSCGFARRLLEFLRASFEFLRASSCLAVKYGTREIEAHLLDSVSDRHDHAVLTGYIQEWKADHSQGSVQIVSR
jgi:hypothetical protein